jgi:peptide/nickel transport system ATP-binding protein
MRGSKDGQEAILDVRGLQVHYLTGRGPVRAVDGVSFTIRKGEVLGLAGESGSGKSTIAHTILRILRPPAVIRGGQVLYRDFDREADVLEMNQSALDQFRWRDVSLVFQSAMNSLNPVATIGDQISDVIYAHEWLAEEKVQQHAYDLLKLVGMDACVFERYPHELSGGMRQRAVIAIALALHPPLLILDEPTTALDVVVQKEVMQEIEALKEQLNLSILFITHDLSLLVEFANRIAVMYAGEIVESAPAYELFENPLHPYTQGLMNSFPSISGEKRKLAGIPGAPPDMAAPPSGCRFHPRCEFATPSCSQIQPRLNLQKKDHSVACHLYP